MEDKEKLTAGKGSGNKQSLFSTGMLLGAVIIIAIAVLFGIYLLAGSGGAVTAIPPQTCGQQVIAYLNANVVAQGTTAELGTVREANGVYEIITRYQGNDIQIYATRDCKLLFTSVYPLDSSNTCGMTPGTCSPSAPQPTPTPVSPVKTARPSAELYVMSFCPYGIQAEKAILPVVSLLGKKADIRIRYIVTVKGDSIGSVQSLHGNTESVEDARQLCILKQVPEKFWQYLSAFDDQCYPIWNNPAQLSECQKNVTIAQGIPADRIDQCASGSEVIGMLRADEQLAEASGATASPTLLINGQVYQGSRTPEAYKQAICAHFDNKPAECDTVLSAQSATASGNCG